MRNFLAGCYFGGLLVSVLVRLDQPLCYSDGSIIYPTMLLILGVVIALLLIIQKRLK